MHELRTVYDLEDALNMFEVVTVQRYNEWLAIESQKQKTGR